MARFCSAWSAGLLPPLAGSETNDCSSTAFDNKGLSNTGLFPTNQDEKNNASNVFAMLCRMIIRVRVACFWTYLSNNQRMGLWLVRTE